MSEKKSESRFWSVFVILLIVFGIISIISNKFAIEWKEQLLITLGGGAAAAVIVVFIFRKWSR